MILGLPLALLAVIVVRALRPVIRIRIGVLVSQRIGHLTGDTEVYLCERDAGLHGKRSFDVFCHTELVCNSQLRKMWGRTIPVWQIVAPLARVNSWVPGAKSHVVPWRAQQYRDIHGLLADTAPHLSFTDQEEKQGKTALQEMGIPEGSPFVCFHARESTYLTSRYPTVEWSGQNVRNFPVEDFMPAVENLTQNGYYAVRMGAGIEDSLNANNPRIIDYAAKFRTDFLDVYLGAKCHHFLAAESGLGTGVPGIFRRPTAFVNWVGLAIVYSWGPDDLSIFKKFWHRKEGRYLGFREIISSDIRVFESSDLLEQSGIDVINNTPEEIADVASEMDQRLNGTWQSIEGDDVLQQKFWSLLENSQLHGVMRSRIGAAFLRQNQGLLDRP